MNASIMEDKPIVYIKTLGGFSLRAGDKEITDSSNQSKKPWCLLEYLVALRRKFISPGELINTVWADDPDANPGGALKALMFRSCRLLEPLGVPPQKLLVQQRGSHCWTQDYSSVLDTDQFESICTQVLNQDMDGAGALRLCLEGPESYKGDFLPKSEYESWVILISAYYHSLYQKLVHKTVELLTKKEDSSRITSICQTAVGIEPFDEGFHYHLVHSLYRDGHTSQAIEEYNHTLDLLYNEFSIFPSDRFKDLYKSIRSKEQGINTNLDPIQETLKEETSGGALYREHPAFHDPFQPERRATKRTDDPIYLCLLTIGDLDGRVPKTAVLNEAMEHLNHAIRDSLRYSDMYTCYSISQYIILPPTMTIEKGEMVMKRILSNFRKLCSRRELIVDYKLQSVLPWERSPTGLRE